MAAVTSAEVNSPVRANNFVLGVVLDVLDLRAENSHNFLAVLLAFPGGGVEHLEGTCF